ncbi:sugar ABC transporter permease [Paenibacillus sp. HB172176]|uniref:carbohydrate ABC transporter permease n=1 Tax=Paenibacillus sp. HB172176 TaxID=2493690 RepID=UPI00143A578B|nr:sugar ABC transporter permease [Paenibacillus sp. HB172176]
MDSLRGMRRHVWPFVFLMPMLVLFGTFTVWPIVGSWIYSFFEWDGFGPLDHFVGLSNYREAIFDPYFWNSFWNTFIIAVSDLVIELPLALLLAVLLNNVAFRGRNVFRLLIFIPVVTTTAVVGVVFTVLLNPVGGPINELLLKTGIVQEPINFLGSQGAALSVIIAMTIWKACGTTMIYWLAGLQTIPVEVYEAAKIDGAGSSKIFLKITIPLLVPIGTIIALLTFIGSLNPFDLVQTMTEGGPNFATDVNSTYIFRYAFNPQGTPRYGFASAAGIVFGLAVLVLTLVQAWALRRVRAGRQVKKESLNGGASV